MVVTLGLAFFLENAFIVWIGSQRESFPRFTSVVWDIGGITLSAQRVLIFVISLVALGLCSTSSLEPNSDSVFARSLKTMTRRC